jgi:hypothetical protein
LFVQIYRQKKCSCTEWIGAEGTLLLREIEEKSRPHRAKPEEARLPPRGKKVPGAKRNGPCIIESTFSEAAYFFEKNFQKTRKIEIK